MLSFLALSLSFLPLLLPPVAAAPAAAAAPPVPVPAAPPVLFPAAPTPAVPFPNVFLSFGVLSIFADLGDFFGEELPATEEEEPAPLLPASPCLPLERRPPALSSCFWIPFAAGEVTDPNENSRSCSSTPFARLALNSPAAKGRPGYDQHREGSRGVRHVTCEY